MIDLNNETTILIINFLLYFTSWLISIKYKFSQLNQLLWLTYSIVAFFSIIIYSNGIYQLDMGSYIENKLSIWPFIYMYLLFVILFEPIRRFNYDNSFFIHSFNSSKLKTLLIIGIVLGSILIITAPLYLTLDALKNFDKLYTNIREDGVNVFPHFYELIFTLYTIFYPLLTLGAFYYICYHKNQRIFIVLLILTATLPMLIKATGAASRGGIFFSITSFVAAYLIFKKQIPIFYKKIIKVIGLSFLALVVPITIYITLSRFSDGSGLNSLMRYFGESYLNFNLIFWDNVSKNPMGERIFPDIYTYFGNVHTFKTTNENINYFYSFTNTPTLLFKTIVGDFYVEFGPIFTVIGIIALSLLTNLMLKVKNVIRFHELIIFFYYFEICFGGIFDFVKGGHSSFIAFVGLTLLYLYLRLNIKTT